MRGIGIFLVAMGLLMVGCGTVGVQRGEAPTFGESGSNWVAGDGKVLTYGQWEPEGDPWGVIVAVHGFSGAASDFDRLGREARARGMVVYALEHRGMGMDPVVEERGDLRAGEDAWVEDLGEFLGIVRLRHPGLPVVLVGESLGVSIALEAMAKGRVGPDQLSGFVALSPVVEMGSEASWRQRQLYRFFLFIAPGRRIDLAAMAASEGAEAPPMTPVEAEQAAMKTAPHRLDVVTLRFVDAAIGSLNRSEDNLGSVTGVPRLLIHGGKDAFIEAEKVAGFGERFEALPGEAEVVFYPEGHHLLMRDYMGDEIVDRILDFCERRESVGR